jgi:hypothetical protein
METYLLITDWKRITNDYWQKRVLPAILCECQTLSEAIQRRDRYKFPEQYPIIIVRAEQM